MPPRNGRGWRGGGPVFSTGHMSVGCVWGHNHMLLKRNDEKVMVKYSDMQIHGRRRKTMQLWVKFWGGNSVHGLEGRHTEHVGTDPDHVPFNAKSRTHCCRGLPPSWPSALDEQAVLPGLREVSPNIPSASSRDQAFHMGHELLITLSLHLQGWHYDGIFIFPLLL